MNNGEFYMCCCIKETREAVVSEQVEGGHRAGRRTGGHRVDRSIDKIDI